MSIDVLSTEESIISNLMRNPELLSKFRLKPEMFTDEKLRVFIEYALEQGKVDVNQIYFKSRDDNEFISTDRLGRLYNSDGTDKAFFMDDQLNLLQEYVLSQAREKLTEYQSMPNKENFNYLVEELEKLKGMTIKKADATDSFLAEVVENILSDEPKQFVKTGIASIDNKIIGFEPGQLNVLGARPSLGKTSLALTMMWNIAQRGYPTTFFSLETGGNNIVDSSVMSAIDQIKKCNSLKIEDQAQMTPQDVREVASQKTDKPHVIFIDYLTLMQSDVPQRDRRLEVEKISRDLKIIAKETGCIIIALSQLSRGVESRSDKRPMMSDLREAGGIEQDANMIFFLYRDDYYDQDQQDNITGKSEIEFIISKNKDGETGVAHLDFYKKTQRFYG
ncbi:MAG: DnaB-like helicase C-terminal domain-containing protein [Staphylococcus epidermidis]|nr:DnaB-like helicase C-terminal domain-containing protein [Staphylococcus epidermidis]